MTNKLAITAIIIGLAGVQMAGGTEYFGLLKKNRNIEKIQLVYSIESGVTASDQEQHSSVSNTKEGLRMVTTVGLKRGALFMTRHHAGSPKTDRDRRLLENEPVPTTFDGYGTELPTPILDIDALDNFAGRLRSGDWLPPLRVADNRLYVTNLTFAAFVIEGNRSIEKYKGRYSIQRKGPEKINGYTVDVYDYSLSGPYTKFFRSKNTPTETEENAVIKWVQSIDLKGTIWIEPDSGIVCARDETFVFEISEHRRQDAKGIWEKAREYIDVRLARKEHLVSAEFSFLTD